MGERAGLLARARSQTGLPQECVGKLAMLFRLVQQTLGFQVTGEVRGEWDGLGFAPLAEGADRQAVQPALQVAAYGSPVVG